jgi:hypothetical protein
MENKDIKWLFAWHDLTKDERAWMLAKVAAVPGEPVRETIIRAQAIKETL